MTKELQDLAWSCLPKEFKEEVKSKYKNAVRLNEYAHECVVFRDLFGEDNLTSDAEEEEMLTCEKSEAMQLYFHLLDLVENERISEYYPEWCDLKREYMALFRKNVFADYFGSKCPPDVSSSEPRDCDNPLADKDGCRWRNDGKCTFNNACYFEPLNPQEPKPAEPKFKVGDMAVVRGFKHPLLKSDGAIVTILSYHDKGDFYSCAIAPNVGIDIDAKYLEPYTEPTDFGREVNFPTKNNLAIYLKKSKNCDNRLQIAAVAMQGILSNIDLFKNVLEAGMKTLSGDSFSYQAVAKASLLFADALIAEERS